MAKCLATHCNKKELCKLYIGNSEAGIHQILDWSTSGSGSISGWGHQRLHIDHHCGDMSENYPKFQSIEVENGKV